MHNGTAKAGNGQSQGNFWIVYENPEITSQFKMTKPRRIRRTGLSWREIKAFCPEVLRAEARGRCSGIAETHGLHAALVHRVKLKITSSHCCLPCIHLLQHV
jgi:hypothetical protein